MKTSSDHILTSHVGSLPRPDDLIAANRAREAREATDEEAFQERLRGAGAEVVRRQRELGIDVPGDGEFGKSMGDRVNYGAWLSYCFHRLGGLDLDGPDMRDMPPRRSRLGEVVLTGFSDRRDRVRFAAAYADPESGITTGPRPATGPVCVGPLTYTGHSAINSDIANFKAALSLAGAEEGFMTSIAPGSTTRIGNTFYKTQEEFLFASADAMREEYKAILDAGLILQLDDPALATDWDMINPADGRGVQEIRDSAGGSAQPRSPGPASGPHPVPPVLGQLAWAAHDRHPDAGHRRVDAGDQRPGLFVRGRQCQA